MRAENAFFEEEGVLALLPALMVSSTPTRATPGVATAASSEESPFEI
jgi:hypothetical protein